MSVPLERALSFMQGDVSPACVTGREITPPAWWRDQDCVPILMNKLCYLKPITSLWQVSVFACKDEGEGKGSGFILNSDLLEMDLGHKLVGKDSVIDEWFLAQVRKAWVVASLRKALSEPPSFVMFSPCVVAWKPWESTCAMRPHRQQEWAWTLSQLHHW